MNIENFKNFFSQLFTELNSQDSVIILTLLGITALLGMLLGWLLRGSAISSLQKKLKESQQRYNTLYSAHLDLQKQYKLKEAEIEDHVVRMQKMETNMQTYEKNQFKLQTALQNAQQKLRTASTSTVSVEKLSQLEAQLAQLEKENKEMQIELEKAMDGKPFNPQPTTSNLTTKMESLESQLAALTAQLSTGNVNTFAALSPTEQSKISLLEEENRDLRLSMQEMEQAVVKQSDDADLQALRVKMAKLEAENARLKMNIPEESNLITNSLKTQNFVSEVTQQNPKVYDRLELEPEEDLLERQQQALLKEQDQAYKYMGDRLATTTRHVDIPQAENPDLKDDLTKVDGIGPFVQTKLNEIGIFTYQQISELDDKAIEKITETIEYYPGKIQRDNWVGQAKDLLS